MKAVNSWIQNLLMLSRASLNLLLASWLGYSMMQLALAQFTAPVTQPIANSVSTTRLAQATVSTPRLEIEPVLNAHLFGQRALPKPAPKAAAMPTDVPETRLNLTLYGIYHSTRGDASYVMLGHNKQPAKRYQQGAEISKSVVLDTIQPKQIILARNGRYERLSLRKPLPTDTATRPTTRQAANNPGVLLKNYQQQLKTNPRNLFKLARISPVSRGGKLIGYRLRPGNDPTLLSQFELRNGDILTSVNGVALDSPLKGLGVVQQLADANRLDIQILRNGQQMQFSYPIAD